MRSYFSLNITVTRYVTSDRQGYRPNNHYMMSIFSCAILLPYVVIVKCSLFISLQVYFWVNDTTAYTLVKKRHTRVYLLLIYSVKRTQLIG